MFATQWGRAKLGRSGGSGGVDDVFTRRHDPGIGARDHGAGKFGHPGREEDPEWKCFSSGCAGWRAGRRLVAEPFTDEVEPQQETPRMRNERLRRCSRNTWAASGTVRAAIQDAAVPMPRARATSLKPGSTA